LDLISRHSGKPEPGVMSADVTTRPVTRRVLIGSALLAGAGLTGLTVGCGEDDDPEPATPATESETSMSDRPGQKVLLAFFSRAGENYYNGDRRFLEVGNTKVLAGMIGDRPRTRPLAGHLRPYRITETEEH
jgi:hypothetical protein